MHEFLKSIGFASVQTKQELKALIDWVLEKPDRMSVVSMDKDFNLAEASREIRGHAGITVVGAIDESGSIVPEYYFPYLSTTHISSDAPLSYEKQSTRDGYVGMCEDDRLGMALIFDVKNNCEVIRAAQQHFPGRDDFTRVSLSLLMSDAMVILPISDRKRVPVSKERSLQDRLLEAEEKNDAEALGQIAQEQIRHFERVMKRLRDTDIFSVVDNFFMPHGMESDRYYVLGTILSRALIVNERTKERYYRMIVESAGMEYAVAVNEKDLQGVPEAGLRLKGHGLLMGDLLR